MLSPSGEKELYIAECIIPVVHICFRELQVMSRNSVLALALVETRRASSFCFLVFPEAQEEA